MSGFIGPIRDISLGIYDGPHATPPEADDGPIFLGIKNVTPGGRLDLTDCKYISEQDFIKWTRRVEPTTNDVVFSYEATLHRYALIPEGFRGCLGRRMALIRPNPQRVLPRFLHYYLMSSQWRAVIEANIISGATVDRIPIKRFPDFEVRIPAIRIQQRIAATLSAYDDLIENNRRRIRLLEEAARLLYREWFVRLRFPGHEHVAVVGGVPEGWGRRKISDVCETVGGGTPSTGVAEYWDGEVTWVVPTDVTRNGCLVLLNSERKITEKGLRESSARMVPAGTILMTSRASVGFFALVDQPVCTNQGFINIIPHQNELRMYLLFNLMHRVDEIRGNAKGSTYPEISKGRFREMEVVIPPGSLVDEFGRVATNVIDQLRILKRMTLQLSKARDLLLPRLMNGEIAV
jgi:type I restriction enzyme S subunit